MFHWLSRASCPSARRQYVTLPISCWQIPLSWRQSHSRHVECGVPSSSSSPELQNWVILIIEIITSKNIFLQSNQRPGATFFALRFHKIRIDKNKYIRDMVRDCEIGKSPYPRNDSHHITQNHLYISNQ